MSCTPGPWEADAYFVTGNVPEGRPGGEVIAECRCTVPRLQDQVDHRANARLIAAAPDLLEALKLWEDETCSCSECIDGTPDANPGPGPWCAPCITRAAIAKAEGTGGGS